MYKSTFMGLNTALRGVLAHQNALDVTGHNISNLSTEGYTRQRAEMVTSPAWSNSSALSATTPGQMGTGVEVLRIERLRDQFIDANVRRQFGRQGDSQALVEQLAQVEAAFQEPGDNGLKALMNKFWSSMDAVAANPQSISARQAFAEAANALANGFNQVATDLQAVASQSDVRLNQTVSEVNSISTRIAQLNSEIRNALEHNHQPNDLLDERDRLMDGLSKLINYTWTENATTGEVTITAFGGGSAIAIVDPAAAPGFTNIARADIDAAFTAGDLTSGRAFADESLWDPATGIIPGFLAQLDTLVNDFVTGVNTQHAAGFDLAGAAGGPLFAGATAATMSFSAAILANPTLVAAASSWALPGEPGNGTNLQTMLNTIRPAAQGALGGQTWEGFYTAVITAVGSRTETAQRDLTNADVLVDMGLARRDQVSGVSLDEEMSNMLRFQHAYNASARVMTAMDESLDIIINRMGRVGL
jgi:flagellar hook-associated protein 1 FlgK